MCVTKIEGTGKYSSLYRKVVEVPGMPHALGAAPVSGCLNPQLPPFVEDSFEVWILGLMLWYSKLSCCRQHRHPMWMLARVPASPLPIQFSADAPGRQGRIDPGLWVSVAQWEIHWPMPLSGE